MYLEPTPDQISLLSQGGDGPVCMVNLLRFQPDGGRESYRAYGAAVRPLLASLGAEVVWQGKADSVVIGDGAEDAWDLVVVVRYPSRSAFLSMISSEAYTEVAVHRRNALVDSRLIACTPM
jgi:uncharacterized protein (DUF1330 family)